MSAEHAQSHDYHLVDPSPWPIFGTIAAAAFFFGFLLYLHPDLLGDGPEPTLTALGFWIVGPGIALLFLTGVFWWRDVIREAEYEGYHKPVVQLGMRYGMALFIASEVMFFVAFFWAFFDASLFPKEMPYDVPGGAWPPAGITPFDAFELPFMNTLILLLSGVTVTWAHHALLQGDRKNMIRGLTITILLGIAFTSLQAFEYFHAPFNIKSGIYGSTFFMATGFHGFHVIIGTTFLIVCLLRARAGHFTPQHHFGFEAAAWYWHFVDVVWLFLFVGVYWWGGG